MATVTVNVPRSERLSLPQVARHIAIGAIVLLAVLLPAGALYQWIGQSLDARRFPQQGHDVALGAAFPGVSLNINCSGQGSPVVVLEAGAGVPGVGWSLVQPGIAQFTRVCSYDRGGYGWSDPGPMPRTSLEIAKELHTLLITAGEKPPYLLVAHSLGAFYVRVYNHEYPAEVAGMVLVDPSDSDQMNPMPPAMLAAMKRQGRQMNTYRTFAPFLIRFGVLRLLANSRAPENPDSNQVLQDEMLYLSRQPKYVETIASEASAMFPEDADEVRASGDLGEKPLIVLSAGEMDQPPVLPKGVTQQDVDALHDAFVHDLHARQAKLSKRGQQIIIPDSHHMIPLERPAAIVDAVRQVSAATDSR
jgi:pimeloyl-ACP methyl ester carboxylesterase